MGNREGFWTSNLNSGCGQGTSSGWGGRASRAEASATRGFPARPGREDTQEAAPGFRGGGPRPRLPVPQA